MSANIAVIIPAYNAERFIGEAIESALSQTLKPDEVIVVDDCSSDATCRVVESFGDAVTLLRNQTNSGAGYSRNRGVRHSKNEFVAFLDADDLWLPRHLESLSSLLVRWPDAGLAFARTEHLGVSRDPWPPLCDIPAVPSDLLLRTLREGFLIPSMMAMRKSAFESIGGFPERDEYFVQGRVQIEDYILALRMALKFKMVGSPEITVRYRFHAQQSSRKYCQLQIARFDYRLKMLVQWDSLACSVPKPVVFDRVVRDWEQTLNTTWAARNMADLRRLCLFGMRHISLWHPLVHYLPRALLPTQAIRMLQVHPGRGVRSE